MKLITANLLDRFWKNGVAPIKKSIGEQDISKIGDGTVTGALETLYDKRMLITLTSVNHTYNTFYTEISCNLKALSPVVVSMITGSTSAAPTYYPVAAYVPSDGTLRIIFNTKAATTTAISVAVMARSDFLIDANEGLLK